MWFLLDENFSWKFHPAMALLEYRVEQVQSIQALGVWDPGAMLGRKAEDADIAQWCGNHHVFVTCDADVRSRTMRMGVLSHHGVKIIFVSPQPSGLTQQVELVIRHYPDWDRQLGVEAPGYSAWLQPPRGRLRKLSR